MNAVLKAPIDHAWIRFGLPALGLAPMVAATKSARGAVTLRLASRWLLAIALFAIASSASARDAALVHFGAADIGHHVLLHYAEEGTGAPVVFVHGSLSDMGYWKEQVDAFAKHYRAIAYSRRYNFPNNNPSIVGYSASVDADDLAAFIRALHLGRVYVVGHSYGALAALIAAMRHPELIRAMVLAEPPAVSLLRDVEGADRIRALTHYADIQRRMVAPMRRDFLAGRREQGVADFIDYVFDNSQEWSTKFSAADRAQTMRNAHEWDVMMTNGTLFPTVAGQKVAQITVPTLVMSGAKSYPFLALIDRYLATRIPSARSVVYSDSGHQMWLQHPTEARAATETFFASVRARERPSGGLREGDHRNSWPG